MWVLLIIKYFNYENLSITFVLASFFLSPKDVNVEEAELFFNCGNTGYYCKGYSDAKAKKGESVYTWNKRYNKCMSDNNCVGGLEESPKTTIGTGL
ncbi:hypothetical protein [Lacinutrix undariae]